MNPSQLALSVEPLDTISFRTAMACFATGVTLVTVRSADGGLHGVTVNSFCSVSLEPMLVLVSLTRSSRGLKLIEDARVFGVNVLSRAQEDVSRVFANRHRPADSARFDGIAFELGATGCPALLDAAANLDCRVHQFVPAGDHVLVIGEVLALTYRPELEPLVFHGGEYRSLASDPAPARRAPLHVVRGS